MECALGPSFPESRRVLREDSWPPTLCPIGPRKSFRVLEAFTRTTLTDGAWSRCFLPPETWFHWHQIFYHFGRLFHLHKELWGVSPISGKEASFWCPICTTNCWLRERSRGR